MEDTVKQRLICFLKYKHLSQAKFESKIGLSNGYVNNIRKSLQPDKLQRIAQSFPELNITWLLTGEEQMLNTIHQQVAFALNHTSAHKVTTRYIKKDFSIIDRINESVWQTICGP